VYSCRAGRELQVAGVQCKPEALLTNMGLQVFARALQSSGRDGTDTA
jgi:anthranilate/para-aminobenzoate synthase component II